MTIAAADGPAINSIGTQPGTFASGDISSRGVDWDGRR